MESSKRMCSFQGNVATIEALLCPWDKYRIQWDDLLEDLSVIEALSNDVYLIRHLVRRKLALSPRESIDALKVRTDYWAAQNTVGSMIR